MREEKSQQNLFNYHGFWTRQQLLVVNNYKEQSTHSNKAFPPSSLSIFSKKKSCPKLRKGLSLSQCKHVWLVGKYVRKLGR